MTRWIVLVGAFVLLMTGLATVSASAVQVDGDVAAAEVDGDSVAVEVGPEKDVAPLEGAGDVSAAAVSANDQVYVPISPCRIADTRVAGGSMWAGEVRDFRVLGTAGFESQGGKYGGCGIPTNATAVELNITAPNASGNGWLRVWPANEPMPNATILSYTPVFSASNAGAVGICTGCYKELRMQTFAYSTQVLLDVFGYYVDNVIPSYSIVEKTSYPSGVSIASDSATCPPGTTLIGGGAANDTFNVFVNSSRPLTFSTWESWLETDNSALAAWTQHTYAICARTTR